MKVNVKNSPGVKVVFTGFLAIVLMIPLVMVRGLVRGEREQARGSGGELPVGASPEGIGTGPGDPLPVYSTWRRWTAGM